MNKRVGWQEGGYCALQAGGRRFEPGWLHCCNVMYILYLRDHLRQLCCSETPIPAVGFPLLSAALGPSTVSQSLPEQSFVGLLIALQDSAGSLPSTELAEDLQRLVH